MASTPSFGMRVSGFGFKFSCFGFGVSDFEFRDAGFGFRVSGFEFRVSGFGFRVLGFGFRLSAFGFQVRMSGFRGREGRKVWKRWRSRSRVLCLVWWSTAPVDGVGEGAAVHILHHQVQLLHGECERVKMFHLTSCRDVQAGGPKSRGFGVPARGQAKHPKPRGFGSGGRPHTPSPGAAPA